MSEVMIENDNNGWLPIETAPKDRDVWVVGLAVVWTGSTSFWWQGQAGRQAGRDGDNGKWLTTSFDDKGKILEIDAKYWRELPELPNTEHELPL